MYPSHQWPPPGPVYDYPTPAPRANKIALIVGIVLVAILGWTVVLAAFQASQDHSHSPSQTPVASVPVSPNDDFFIWKLDGYGLPASAHRAQWINVGHLICTQLREGTSIDQLGELVYQETGIPYPSQSNGVVIGVSVAAYCPSPLR
jgi:hypothetical protein